METTVVNLRREPYDVYIGRAGHGLDGYFGNPHPVGWCPRCGFTHERGDALVFFKQDFIIRMATDPEYRERVRSLKGKRLGCFCKEPDREVACHGDVYVEYLESPEFNVRTIEQDIFKADIQAIIHQANCQCTMGSGIAKALRDKWPVVYEADCKTAKNDYGKLGGFSTASINDASSPVRYVFNLYGQFLYGRDRRYTDYEAVAEGLGRIRVALETEGTSYGVKRIGIPYKMSCNLAGGNWRIVHTIIEEAFRGAPFDVWICRKL